MPIKNKVVICPKCGHKGTLSYKKVVRPNGRVDWYLVVDHRGFGYKGIHTIRRIAGPPTKELIRRKPSEPQQTQQQPARKQSSGMLTWGKGFIF